MNNNVYIPQTTHLKNVVHSIWQTERFAVFHREQIIPKGIVEIIFNFSDSLLIPALLGSKPFHLSSCFINGFNTAPIELQLPKQQVFFGVQFQPLAVKKIFGIPACEFSDNAVDLFLLDSALRALWHQLAEQNNFDKRVSIFCAWIERKSPDWQPQEKLINNFLCAVNQHDAPVTELANSLCYSPRHLSRKIFEATGMNTEEILLYKKYLHAVHLIHYTGLSLTEIAYQSHFSDQSHFIKSFKAYTKMTPGEYKRNKGYMKGHLYEHVENVR
ncbi:MAG: AraC-type DNA-binding protein [Chitinophagaceae bacterium]|nr:AraC-type DNA-binding protein [Chitinophagaceae bacterium]